MAGALVALVCCAVSVAPLPSPPSSEASGPVRVEAEVESPVEVVHTPEAEEGTQPAAPEEVETTPPSPAAIDRVELRNGDRLEGELVEVVSGSHVTLRIEGTDRIQTFNWAQIEYVQRAGEPREAVSAGKRTIAELATESDEILQEETIGLGFAYAAYSLVSPSISTWIGFFLNRSDRLLYASVGTTVTSAVLLSIGAGFFFHARARRKRLRRVILSAAPTSGGALAGAIAHF